MELDHFGSVPDEESQIESWFDVASKGDVHSNMKFAEWPHAKTGNSFLQLFHELYSFCEG